MNVFELSAQFRELEAAVESGDLTIEDATRQLECLDTAFEEKVANIGYAIRNREAALAGMEQAMNALARRMETTANEIDRLKGLAIHLLNVRGAKKVPCPYFTVSVQTNAPAVVIKDEDKIPPEYWREIPPVPASIAVDKAKVKADAKEGVIIPGVELVASQRLNIK